MDKVASTMVEKGLNFKLRDGFSAETSGTYDLCTIFEEQCINSTYQRRSSKSRTEEPRLSGHVSQFVLKVSQITKLLLARTDVQMLEPQITLS